MKINLVGKNIELTKALKETTESKLERIENLFDGEVLVRGVMSVRKKAMTFELTVNSGETVVRSEETTTDMYESVDKAIDRIIKQLRKHRDKLKTKRLHGYESIRFENIPEGNTSENVEEQKVVKTKKFSMKPMSMEEALIQMDLVGHDFFVYYDDEVGEVCVVYKRTDGNYGLIEPDLV